MIALTDRSVAEIEDGTPAPAGTPDEDLFYPMCYRDSSEIKQRPSVNRRHAAGVNRSTGPARSLVSRTSTWSAAATSTQSEPPLPL
jgi:hypothetical protein